MSEALDFIKNFEDLIKQNETEQRKTTSLKSVKEALEKEVNTLNIRKLDLERQLIDIKKEADIKIAECQENMERNFEVERNRIATLSEKLDKQRIKSEQREEDIRHKESVANERERLLTEKEHKLDYKEVDLQAKEEQVKNDSQAIAAANMGIQRQLQAIEEQLKGIGEAKQGIQDNQAELKKQQSAIREERVRLELETTNLGIEKKEIVKSKKELESGQIKLLEANKLVNAERFILDKQKKDNLDKENALKAMQVEMDFKLAQFKRKYEKDNK